MFMLICIVLAGSPGPSTDADNILPTSRVLQEKLEETCQTPQIGSPVTGVRDIVTTGDQKSELTTLYLLSYF